MMNKNKNIRFMSRELQYKDEVSITRDFTAVKINNGRDEHDEISFEAIMPSSNFNAITFDQISNINYSRSEEAGTVFLPQFLVQTSLDLVPHLHSQGIPISDYKIQIDSQLGVQKCSHLF